MEPVWLDLYWQEITTSRRETNVCLGQKPGAAENSPAIVTDVPFSWHKLVQLFLLRSILLSPGNLA